MTTAQQETTSSSERPAAVYRLWAADGALLYIGSSYTPEERAKAHSHTVWGHLVARRTDEWHPSRWRAYDEGAQAIAAEDPTHNVVGTPRHTGPAERGRVQREASEARWSVALAAIRTVASEGEARNAGGWAEVEYLEASGLMPGLAAKWRHAMEHGGTYNSRNMSLPRAVNGRLTWEMSMGEILAARRAEHLTDWGGSLPNPDRTERLGLRQPSPLDGPLTARRGGRRFSGRCPGACPGGAADAGGMSGLRLVVVSAPLPSGGRRVRAGGEILGLAFGARDVEEFLRRAGLEDVDVETSELIEWQGGGPDVWAPGP
ncbi:hypothetical protein [Streptomyces sp. NPDC056165]|uniref:hypothetical protein n=2 Tax=unclassified Streptomyces TaxID=2593676 RepID=UPI0035DB0BF5